MQAELPLPHGEMQLPALQLGPIKYTVGTASYIIRPQVQVEITQIDSINIGPRSKAECLSLSNGERILVLLKKKKFKIPEDVDGVILQTSSDEYEWIFHREISRVEEYVKEHGLASLAKDAAETWRSSVSYRAEKPGSDAPENRGLRPPQLGALFSVGAHWSASSTPATIVMPTGTGKTETMLAVLAAHEITKLLVAVPSKALRDQTAGKFSQFGLLRFLGVLSEEARNPVVGTLTSRPKTLEDLKLFEDCNVVVGTVSSLGDGTANALVREVAGHSDVLIVDEAHHVKAKTWEHLKSGFNKKRVLQFTATPFRGDGKLVDGSLIYSYTLSSAQEDGYFKPIEFVAVQELDQERADRRIAEQAIDLLRADLEDGFDHFLMARCRTKDRAEEIYRIYREKCPEYNPVLIHSDIKAADERVEELRLGKSRIVVCVNMLGEGVDIPQLKIAAIHDKHQSLAVLLQFVGRFTRTGGANLGDAKAVANIADPLIADALEQLYGEDADWNSLLSEMSSHAARDHAELVKFLASSTPLETDSDAPEISLNALRPTFSSLFYRAPKFQPKRFFNGLPDKHKFIHGWINSDTETLFFITRTGEPVKWARRAKNVNDVEWDLFVLHFDQDRKLLYLASTNKDSSFEALAKAVGATSQLSGEQMFRSMGRIGRLVFNNVGVSKHGRKNLSYAMYTGADVKRALSETEKHGSRKSNVSGHGWESGKQVTIGCSHRGRVWSKAAGSIPQFVRWVANIGDKLVDETIDTASIIENVLIPEYATALPECDVLSIEWPAELIAQNEDQVVVSDGSTKHQLHELDIQFVELDRSNSKVIFEVASDNGVFGKFSLRLLPAPDDESTFQIESEDGAPVTIGIGRKPEVALTNFFSDWPPLVRFVDLSELDGNLLLKSESPTETSLPPSSLEVWDWTGTDITKESIWKDGTERRDSVQWRTAQHYLDQYYDLVFDDDGAGEAADLVCFKLEPDHILLSLVHCKFSGRHDPGKRVKDVVEVASQAVRSARWPGHMPKLLRHVKNRNNRYARKWSRSYFLAGSPSDLARLQKAIRFMEVRTEIVVVQPGLSVSEITEAQSTVLGASSAYLKQTLDIDLRIIGSV